MLLSFSLILILMVDSPRQRSVHEGDSQCEGDWQSEETDPSMAEECEGDSQSEDSNPSMSDECEGGSQSENSDPSMAEECEGH